MLLYFTFVLLGFNVIAVHATRVLAILYALNLGASPIAVGLLAATFAVFPTLPAMQAGKIIDRLGSRLPIMLGSSISGCALLLPFFFASLPALFVAAAISGLGTMFCGLSSQNLIGGFSNSENRTRNFNNASLVVAAATAGGPLIAGFSIDHLGHAATFLCVIVLFFTPVALLMLWGSSLPGGQRRPGHRHGILRMLKNPMVWPLLVASSLSQGGLELFVVYLPVYGVTLGLSASKIGVILAMVAVGGFLARIVMMYLIAWFGEERLLAYALFVGAVGFFSPPFFESAFILGLVALIFGFGMNCTQPICISLLYGRAPQGQVAEALGLRFALDNGAKLVSPGIFGVIASAMGVSAVFWINALVLACGGLLSRHGSEKAVRQLNKVEKTSTESESNR